MPHTALIIDDEADIRELIALSLDRIGLNTHTAANLEEARNLLDAYHFDVCLTDMRLPDGNGVEFVTYVQSIQPELPVAVITAHGNMDAAVEAMKKGAFDFVSKPVDITLLRDLVTQAINAHDNHAGKKSNEVQKPSSEKAGSSDIHTLSSAKTAVERDNDTKANPEAESRQSQNHATDSHEAQATHDPKLSPSLAALSGRSTSHSNSTELLGQGKLVGRSEPMQELRLMISKVAKTNAPVWITGESGTGKELIARLVHENSPRSSSPFVAINCGAIPSELMESEMFGHRKGSFTGAHSDHDGLFKRAEGGTLFLDEVAELPLHMQVKLLRAIQERTVRPVGSAEEITTNVRILSASHKDLAAEVEDGHFRHDLYYRLNVICICAPSLRDRPEDVADLARHILKSIALSEGSSSSAVLSPEAEARLSTYAFPGNVRELENILERAMALTDGGSIEVTDLNISDNLPNTNTTPQLTIKGSAANDSTERRAILEMLSQTRWNRKMAAQRLGLSYRQLRYRIKQYGIDEDETGT